MNDPLKIIKKLRKKEKKANFYPLLELKQFLTYRLNGGHDCGYDEHGGERDHDPIGEVVDGKVEGEITNSDQNKSLEQIGMILTAQESISLTDAHKQMAEKMLRLC